MSPRLFLAILQFSCAVFDTARALNLLALNQQNAVNQGCTDGGIMSPPIFSKLQESWSKVSHAARGMVTVFSVGKSLQLAASSLQYLCYTVLAIITENSCLILIEAIYTMLILSLFFSSARTWNINFLNSIQE